MKFEEYRREIHALYGEYVRLWQASGGELPRRLPAIHRAHYEKFELIVDLTATVERITEDIEELKTQILEARSLHQKALSTCFPHRMVISDPPRPKGRRSLDKIIETVKTALEVHRHENGKRLSAASAVWGLKDTKSDKACKNAERKVRMYFDRYT